MLDIWIKINKIDSKSKDLRLSWWIVCKKDSRDSNQVNSGDNFVANVSMTNSVIILRAALRYRQNQVDRYIYLGVRPVLLSDWSIFDPSVSPL